MGKRIDQDLEHLVARGMRHQTKELDGSVRPAFQVARCRELVDLPQILVQRGEILFGRPLAGSPYDQSVDLAQGLARLLIDIRPTVIRSASERVRTSTVPSRM